MRTSIATTFALLAAILASAGCSDGHEGPGDVLLITIDTLRPDRMGIYGHDRATTPNLDRWFRDGAIYTRSYSTEANTPPSVVSMLTGALPQEHGVRLFYQLLPDRLPLVTDLLPESYQTFGVVANNVLTDEALGIAPHFDFYDDLVGRKVLRRNLFERDAADNTDAAIRLLEAGDPHRPLFLWVHYIDPHGPYHPPEDWKRTFTHSGSKPVPSGRMPSFTEEPGVRDGLTYADLYDEEVAYLDHHVDRLLNAFSESRPGDSLILFSADHGESMMEHEEWFTHGYQVYEEIVRVPLLVSGPQVPSGRFDELTSGIDLLPTILAFAGVEPPPHVAGHDLRRPEEVPENRTVYSEATWGKAQWRSAVQGDAKWVVRLVGGRGSVQERFRFDLASDPGELQRLGWEEIGGGAALLQLCADDPDPAGRPPEFRKGFNLTAPKVAPRVTPEQMEKLRSLGYLD